MDLKEIKQIIELMNKHGLSYFSLEHDQAKVTLKKGMDLDALSEQLGTLRTAAPAAPAPAAPAAPAAAAPAVGGDESGPPPGEVEITSPMVGTFYRSPSPEAESFVDVGSPVKADSTVCIIEAMKVMNEIKAEFSGTITKVLVENGAPVQYGEPLFYAKSS